MDGLLKELSSHQLAEWQAYYQLEPWGWEAELLGNGVTAAAVWNVHKKKNAPMVRPTDFLPREDGSSETISEVEHPGSFFRMLKETLVPRSKNKGAA